MPQALPWLLNMLPYRFLKGMLNHDCKMYGVAPGTTALTPIGTVGGGDESLTQRLVEDFVGVPRPAITSQGPWDIVHS